MRKMQQGMARLGIVLLVLALLIGGGLAALMVKEVPPPQQNIEKQLDAKTFLEQKRP